MITPEQSIERTVQALCSELHWGLRFFFAAKSLNQSELKLTPTLFETFTFSCLDDASLILSRMVIAKDIIKNDDSVNVQYLFRQAGNNPSLFRFANPGEIESMIPKHLALLDSHKGIIDILKNQRDKNLAHLDRKHVNQPGWHESQPELNWSEVESLYQDLVSIMNSYFKLFYGKKFDFGNWETISQGEVDNLIEYFDAYNSKK